MSNTYFNSIIIIGVGLIGSSIARALKKNKISNNIYGIDTNLSNIDICQEQNVITEGYRSLNEVKTQVDLIIICTPLGTYNKIFSDINTFVTKETLITDVGSTKVSVIEDFNNSIKNDLVEFIPSHPIAGLEKSGPKFGFAELFENRFCILTPFNNNKIAIKKIKNFWESIRMQVEIMEASHHDRVMAMTSHLPQLIAYSIVFTADELEEHLKEEILKYSAAGFRDFTRLAGSDPVMWRDVYSKNKNAVIEMLGRFTEDLSTLQKAIRNEDSQFLENTFLSTKKIRKKIEDLGQAGFFDPTESNKKRNKF